MKTLLFGVSFIFLISCDQTKPSNQNEYTDIWLDSARLEKKEGYPDIISQNNLQKEYDSALWWYRASNFNRNIECYPYIVNDSTVSKQRVKLQDCPAIVTYTKVEYEKFDRKQEGVKRVTFVIEPFIDSKNVYWCEDGYWATFNFINGKFFSRRFMNYGSAIRLISITDTLHYDFYKWFDVYSKESKIKDDGEKYIKFLNQKR